jgi:hypothetical protein
VEWHAVGSHSAGGAGERESPGHTHELASARAERNPGQSPNKFGTNPLTGKPFFSASVFDQATSASTGDQLFDVPIYLQPTIELQWRAIGFDGENNFDGDAVPQYFLDRGASNTPAVDAALQNFDPGQLVAAVTPPQGLPLLRVCELWMHQPRLGLTSAVTIQGDAIATGLSDYEQTPSVATSEPNDSLRLMSGEFAAAQQPAL